MFSYSSVAQSDERSRKFINKPLNPYPTIDKSVRFCCVCQRTCTPPWMPTFEFSSWMLPSNGWTLIIKVEPVKKQRTPFF